MTDGIRNSAFGRRAVLRSAAGVAVLPAAVDGAVDGWQAKEETATGSTPGVRWSNRYDGDRVRVDRAGDVLVVLVDGTLRGVDVFDGTERWAIEDWTGGDALALVHEGTGYLFDYTNLRAFDPGTGERLWSRNLGESPVGLGSWQDRLLVGGRAGGWFVLDGADGSVVQSGSLDGSWAFVAGVDDGTLYVHAGEGPLRAVSVEDGSVEWTLDAPVVGATLQEGTLYVGSSDRTLRAVDPATGETRWTFEGDASQSGGMLPAVRDGMLFAVSLGHLYRLDPETGDDQWEFAREGAMYLPRPEGIADGSAFVTVGGHVHAVDLESGTERWRHYTRKFRANLLLAYGTLFVGAGATVRALSPDGTERWSRSLDGPDGNYEPPRLTATDGVLAAVNGPHLGALDVNREPEADFAVEPVSPTAADAVTFAADAADRESAPESLTYQWEFGDGSEATGRTVEHAYGSAGSYEVTLTVTDPAGADATASQSLDVAPTPTPSPTSTAEPASQFGPGFGTGLAAGAVGVVAAWLARRRQE